MYVPQYTKPRKHRLDGADFIVAEIIRTDDEH